MRSRLLRRRDNTAPFATLLATLVVALFVPPFFDGSVFGIAPFRLVVIAILISGVYAVSRSRRLVWIAGAIAGSTLSVEALAHLWPIPALTVASFSLSILFPVFLGAVMLRTIITESQVTHDTILGGICIYLLLGIAWSIAYSFLEYLEPGSFSAAGAPLPPPPLANDHRLEDLIYFSFVTLTTLGYGDILARTNPARALATGEAVTGSLFLAIFIARLVGLHMFHENRNLDP